MEDLESKAKKVGLAQFEEISCLRGQVGIAHRQKYNTDNRLPLLHLLAGIILGII
jgi:hypothetical protein